jgi:LytS/YehU family sensor histidine kinase
MRDQEQQLPQRYIVLDNALALILAMYRWPIGVSLAVGAISGLVLGIAGNYLGEDAPAWFAMTGLAYILLGPLVMGYFIVRYRTNPSWPYRLVAPIVVTLVMMLCLSAVSSDAAILVACLILIALPMSWLGAILGCWRPMRGRTRA